MLIRDLDILVNGTLLTSVIGDGIIVAANCGNRVHAGHH